MAYSPILHVFSLLLITLTLANSLPINNVDQWCSKRDCHNPSKTSSLNVKSEDGGKFYDNSMEVTSSQDIHKAEKTTAVGPNRKRHKSSHKRHRVRANVVVAQDGSGKFRTITEAVAAVASMRSNNETRFVIHVKTGTYHEYIDIPYGMNDVTMIGDGIRKTIITGDKSAAGKLETFDTRTFGVFGNGFIAKGITFRNTAGCFVDQAVALLSLSDRSAFYRCRFEGYQDTLYLHSGTQFFKECDIFGSVDMIFGDATAVLQSCSIYLRKPRYNQVTIVAQKREYPNSTTGIVIQNSSVILTHELASLMIDSYMEIYLGRPWGRFSRTVFMNTYLEGIDSKGWMKWDENTDENLVYYAEFRNTGPGSLTDERVEWRGVHAMEEHEALEFTVGRFINGDAWLPATGIPYTSGLCSGDSTSITSR